jgi:hypothetical protein
MKDISGISGAISGQELARTFDTSAPPIISALNSTPESNWLPVTTWYDYEQ